MQNNDDAIVQYIRDKSNDDLILGYVRDNPGCNSIDVIRGTSRYFPGTYYDRINQRINRRINRRIKLGFIENRSLSLYEKELYIVTQS